MKIDMDIKNELPSHNRDGIIFKGQFISGQQIDNQIQKLLSRRPSTRLRGDGIDEIKDEIDKEIKTLIGLKGKTIK